MQVIKPSKRTNTVYVKLSPYRNGKFQGKILSFPVYGISATKLRKFLMGAIEKGQSNGRN
jgi:hypothetical protein